jgi:hypothetical protein
MSWLLLTNQEYVRRGLRCKSNLLATLIMNVGSYRCEGIKVTYVIFERLLVGFMLKNRITGNICHVEEISVSCWPRITGSDYVCSL